MLVNSFPLSARGIQGKYHRTERVSILPNSLGSVLENAINDLFERAIVNLP